MKLRQKRSYFQNINQQITLVSISTFIVDILVAGKIEFMKVISLEISNPTTCIYVSNHEMLCNVIKRDFHERWICYKRSFTALHPKLIVFIPSNMLYNIEIVVMEQIVLARVNVNNTTASEEAAIIQEYEKSDVK
jgi:hypothetical protein